MGDSTRVETGGLATEGVTHAPLTILASRANCDGAQRSHVALGVDGLILMTFSASENDVFVVVKTDGDSSGNRGDDIVVALDAEFVAAVDADLRSGSWHLCPELRGILQDMRFRRPAGRLDALYVQAKATELACLTAELLTSGALTPSSGSRDLSEFDARRVVRAQDLIHQRFAENLTLHGIARACGLNRSLLSRGFRLMFKVSVAQYLADTRLEAARRLLVTSDLTISSVGHACGYSNNAAFTRAFGRRFGASPSVIRRQVSGGPAQGLAEGA